MRSIQPHSLISFLGSSAKKKVLIFRILINIICRATGASLDWPSTPLAVHVRCYARLSARTSGRRDPPGRTLTWAEPAERPVEELYLRVSPESLLSGRQNLVVE